MQCCHITQCRQVTYLLVVIQNDNRYEIAIFLLSLAMHRILLRFMYVCRCSDILHTYVCKNRDGE